MHYQYFYELWYAFTYNLIGICFRWVFTTFEYYILESSISFTSFMYYNFLTFYWCLTRNFSSHVNVVWRRKVFYKLKSALYTQLTANLKFYITPFHDKQILNHVIKMCNRQDVHLMTFCCNDALLHTKRLILCFIQFIFAFYCTYELQNRAHKIFHHLFDGTHPCIGIFVFFCYKWCKVKCNRSGKSKNRPTDLGSSRLRMSSDGSHNVSFRYWLWSTQSGRCPGWHDVLIFAIWMVRLAKWETYSHITSQWWYKHGTQNWIMDFMTR